MPYLAHRIVTSFRRLRDEEGKTIRTSEYVYTREEEAAGGYDSTPIPHRCKCGVFTEATECVRCGSGYYGGHDYADGFDCDRRIMGTWKGKFYAAMISLDVFIEKHDEPSDPMDYDGRYKHLCP